MVFDRDGWVCVGCGCQNSNSASECVECGQSGDAANDPGFEAGYDDPSVVLAGQITCPGCGMIYWPDEWEEDGNSCYSCGYPD